MSEKTEPVQKSAESDTREPLGVFYCPELDIRVRAADINQAVEIFKKRIKEGK